MGRTLEVGMFSARSVAGQAAGTGILHTEIFEADDLCYVAASFDVRRAGAMAGLATVPFHRPHLFSFLQEIAVRRKLKLIEHLLMAGLTSF